MFRYFLRKGREKDGKVQMEMCNLKGAQNKCFLTKKCPFQRPFPHKKVSLCRQTRFVIVQPHKFYHHVKKEKTYHRIAQRIREIVRQREASLRHQTRTNHPQHPLLSTDKGGYDLNISRYQEAIARLLSLVPRNEREQLRQRLLTQLFP